MPKDEKNFKRQVRARMGGTDESYATARMNLERSRRGPAGGSFFENAEEAPQRPAIPRQPSWANPPDDLWGVLVDYRALVALTPKHALVIDDIVAYPTGFSFEVLLRGHELGVRAGVPAASPGGSSEVMALRERWRVGLVDASGTKTISGFGSALNPFGKDAVEERERIASLVEPPYPFVIPRGGRGGNGRSTKSYWCCPLPPAGPLTIVIGVEVVGFEEHTVILDAGIIIDAAAKSRDLWSYPPGSVLP